MRAAQDDHVELAAIRRRQLAPGLSQVCGRDLEHAFRGTSLERFVERRGFRSDPNHVKQRDASRRRSRGCERLEVILDGMDRHAVDHWNSVLRELADEVPEYRKEL